MIPKRVKTVPLGYLKALYNKTVVIPNVKNEGKDFKIVKTQ